MYIMTFIYENFTGQYMLTIWSLMRITTARE